MEKEFVNVVEVLGRISRNDFPAEYWEAVAGLYEDVYKDMDGEAAKTAAYNVLPVWAVFVAGYMMAERETLEEKEKAWRKGYRARGEDEWKRAHGITTGGKTVTTWKEGDGDIGNYEID